VVYDYDGYYIDAIPMPNHTGPAIITSYKKAHKFLESRGFKLLMQRLENEAYQVLQSFMAEANIYFQMVLPPRPRSQCHKTSKQDVQKACHCQTVQHKQELFSIFGEN
jgi:hypothetical protein